MAIARTVSVFFKALTGNYEAGQKKMQDATAKTKKSIVDAGRAGGKTAGIVGSGFSAASAGIALATASAESFEGAMVSAGGALAAGFASGGPVGLAIASLGAGVGLLVKAGRESEKIAAANKGRIADSYKAATKEVKALAREEERLLEILRGREQLENRLADLKRRDEIGVAEAAVREAQKLFMKVARGESMEAIVRGKRTRIALPETDPVAIQAGEALAAARERLKRVRRNQMLREFAGKAPTTTSVLNQPDDRVSRDGSTRFRVSERQGMQIIKVLGKVERNTRLPPPPKWGN